MKQQRVETFLHLGLHRDSIKTEGRSVQSESSLAARRFNRQLCDPFPN